MISAATSQLAPVSRCLCAALKSSGVVSASPSLQLSSDPSLPSHQGHHLQSAATSRPRPDRPRDHAVRTTLNLHPMVASARARRRCGPRRPFAEAGRSGRSGSALATFSRAWSSVTRFLTDWNRLGGRVASWPRTQTGDHSPQGAGHRACQVARDAAGRHPLELPLDGQGRRREPRRTFA